MATQLQLRRFYLGSQRVPKYSAKRGVTVTCSIPNNPLALPCTSRLFSDYMPLDFIINMV